MTGGKRPRAGRKAIRIDLPALENLCGLQCTDVEVASYFKVSVRTIERRKNQPAFAEAMERGRAAGKLSVRRMLFTQANKGNVAAAIFLAKNVLGYKDFVTNELSGPNGGPIEVDQKPKFSNLSHEEMLQLRAIAEKAKPPRRD
jgi:hypothetical protein